jgi:hypothetical protein
VIDFTGGRISSNQVSATDPSPMNGTSALLLVRSGVRTQVRAASHDGITVSLTQGSGRLRIAIRAAKGRFKYLSYTVVTGNRIAIDLWKSTPPSHAAVIRRGTGGCLTLDGARIAPNVASAAGREQGVFENQFQVVLRGSDGSIIAQRHVYAHSGRWNAQLNYHAKRRQAGTLEAAASSPKDGARACLAQRRVTIQASPIASVKVLARYPAACLHAVRRPTGNGMIAALNARRVTIASPIGGARTVLPVQLPASGSFPPVNQPAGAGNRPPQLQWSPDGRYLATDDGRLWNANGTAAGRLFAKLPGSWSWSPTSDCAIGITSVGTMTPTVTISLAVPGRRAVPFLREALSQFAFSPGGRQLIFTVADAAHRQHFFQLDLASGRVQDMAIATTSDPSVIFGGWAPGNHVLLFWSGLGASILADGVQLRGLDLAHSGRLLTYGNGFIIPTSQSLARCGPQELAVIGEGRPYPTITNKRLGYVAAGAPAEVMTPARQAYVSPACSRDNTSIAAVQYAEGGRATGPARLALLTATGALRYCLTPDSTFTDSAPEWAESGILYGRTPIGTATAQLWFAPHGSGSHDTTLRATAWDWSATPPNGLS